MRCSEATRDEAAGGEAGRRVGASSCTHRQLVRMVEEILENVRGGAALCHTGVQTAERAERRSERTGLSRRSDTILRRSGQRQRTARCCRERARKQVCVDMGGTEPRLTRLGVLVLT